MSESEQDFDVVDQEVSQEVEAVEVEQAEPEAEQKKGDASYIDYNELPDTVRDKVKMRIDSDFKKLKSLERQHQDVARKAKELEDKLAEAAKPKEVPPPSPDDWYSDSEQAQKKLQAHIESVRSQTQWDYEKQQREQLRQAELMEQSVRKQNELFEKAKNAGINQDKLRYSAAVLMQNRIDDNVANYIVEHEFAPQLINYLAENPVEVQAISAMSPFQVGVKLNDIAKAYRPKKVSNAPEPDSPIRGSGVNIGDNPVLKGSRIF
jgi:hypothetical protein